ncbi:hypothetical protein VD0002_g1513 [Verticillium dahliae]|uniref:UDP-glucose:glycoprotein glucosyltransferase n=1 Tax=Verticillium dahliae TaxID=27337 RepID=A0AA45AI74_VERDA|nr:1-phosphatidylinositol-4,5-bisphosphate phosphodiesterase 1 [Verticillium dahliae VDG2]KAH6685152.1 UDP-glucose:glycoprotein glucosyltransferase [Verticillium dahliae]PNH27724.1 hypothetical protein BJF96_g9005 [Verticillium dahliae]PNH46505.1 hypothetical protein VD0004_g1598 [Verticillium dahliae]PNH54731.1 hypothetical protein VD0003_g2834 [Verticillium dahliae]
MTLLCRSPLGLVAIFWAAVNVSAGPSVNVHMQAAFPAGPYLLELLETAAGENATSYFPILDRIASGHFKDSSTHKALYDDFLQLLQDDNHINSPDALSTFKLALSMRLSAPRIEAHYQYYDTAVATHVTGGKQQDCEIWLQFAGSQYCSPTLENPEARVSSIVKLLPFDRVIGTGTDVALYADPASSAFGAFHQALAQKARNGEISYRLRYRRAVGALQEPLPVNGYGVELALKRTDYIVIDDREAQTDGPQKSIATEVVLDKEEEVADLKPLSTSDLAPLGLKAASFITQSQDPWDALLKLTQDFPKFSSSLATHEVSEDFLAEHDKNRAAMAPSGLNALWMNGVQLTERQIEAFTLIDMLRRERRLIDNIRNLGLTGQQAALLLGHPKVASAKNDDEPPRFDWRDEIEEGKVIIWLNDLEKDARYKDLPSELTSLLQRTYPGQLPSIRRNIFTLVVPVDLTSPEDVTVISNLFTFVERRLPVRFGLVPLTPSDDKVAQAKAVYHLMQNYGPEAMVAYLQQSVEDAKISRPDQIVFDRVVAESVALPEASTASFDDVMQSEEQAERIKLAQHWVKRLNAGTTIPPFFLDGLLLPRDKGWLRTMSMKIGGDLQTIQRGIYMGLIEEDEWVPGRFLKGALSRRNSYIFPEDEKSIQILDVNKIYAEHDNLFSAVPVIQGYAEATKETWAALTIVGDLTTQAGRDLLFAALRFQRANPGIRLDIVHNSASTTTGPLINAALRKEESALTEVETPEQLKAILDAAETGSDGDYTIALASFLSAATIAPGANALILNGRVIGPITEDLPFDEDDFQLFLESEQTARILPVYAALEDLSLADRLSGPLAAAKLTSITALSTISDVPEGIFESASTVRVNSFEAWDSKHTAIEVGNAETASIHLTGLLNPVSEQGQRWAPILKVLSELDGVHVKLFLNPKEEISELPVKRFFRYVLDSAPSFDESGKVRALGATFKGLPSEALLTTGMDIPPSWLVAPKVCVHDPDNIKLSSIKGDVNVIYQLENILIEGHSREGKAGQPPRGAQVVLGTEKEPLLADTIIMANLGYFQFKANPGFYNINLKDGKTTEIYTIESIGAQGWAPVPGDEGTEVALMDFQGTTLYPRLKRKPGQEKADVLQEDEAEEDGGIISQGLKFAESLLGGSTKSLSAQEHADINIFSVASGHLYERMLNIMMVSVMKNTKHTVKFWFIEQFLSPSFKDFIPHLAEEYGFKYEMVTFKWPHWLRQQKEKQREIWGYKILFLDVLFPLSLDKVIFVDADQIVRTDMMDLVNHPLEGDPYGFTPMCDSRTEMEGFRFWKQGYWANYLRGQPYHISALYVVDLRRFRDLAAGDRLRQQYHALSADPNSLANLDQDLPNHMQFTIPIHSLPQEWLWCETWCSDESQAEARTIDLCNNPQTKEPKLDRARRQVPEWTVYDDEIAALDRRRRGVPEEVIEKNPKSRTLEEPKSTGKDEL